MVYSDLIIRELYIQYSILYISNIISSTVQYVMYSTVHTVLCIRDQTV